jgi:hypothetical protein
MMLARKRLEERRGLSMVRETRCRRPALRAGYERRLAFAADGKVIVGTAKKRDINSYGRG